MANVKFDGAATPVTQGLSHLWSFDSGWSEERLRSRAQAFYSNRQTCRSGASKLDDRREFEGAWIAPNTGTGSCRARTASLVEQVVHVKREGSAMFQYLRLVTNQKADERIRRCPYFFCDAVLVQIGVATKSGTAPVGTAAEVETFERTALDIISSEKVGTGLRVTSRRNTVGQRREKRIELRSKLVRPLASC